MAKDSAESTPAASAGRWVSGLGLGIAAAAVLVLGAVLQADPADGRERRAPSAPVELPLRSLPIEQPRADVPARAPVAARPAPAPVEPPAPAAPVGGEWTAQIGVFCDRERVQSLVHRFDLTVTSAQVDGRACHRLWWGRYPTREAAERAADLPPALRKIAPSPIPQRIEDVGP